MGALTKPTCDLNRVWEWAEEQIVPNYKTKGAEATKPQKTTCDQTLNPAAVGAESKLSTPRPRATLLWEALRGAEAATHVPSLASVDGQQHPSGSVAVPKVECDHTPGFAPGFVVIW